MNATEQEKDFIADLNAGEDILGIYADWLKETDQWSQEGVYRKVLLYPEQDWARLLYAMWLDDEGDRDHADAILWHHRTTRYRELDKERGYLRPDVFNRVFSAPLGQINEWGMTAYVACWFIDEIRDATFDSWHAHGPAIVAQHPITFVRPNVPENFYINYRDTGWLENSPHPEWYVVHWNGMSKSKTPTPFRKTREEAVAWTSKVLLSWARKQAGLGL